jgi:hypothetical protein
MFSLDKVQPTYQLQPLDLVSPGFRGINTVQAGSLLDPSYCVTASNAVIDTSGRLSARFGVTTQTTTPITKSVTFTAPPTGSGGTLTAAWTPITGTYNLTFSTGQVVVATFTQGSTAVTWATPVTGTPTTAGVAAMPILTAFEASLGASSFQNIVSWSGGISNNVANPLSSQIQGAVNANNGQWFFGNFNNKVIGFQAGQKPIVWTGTGNFATVVESAGTAPSGGVGCTAFGRVWATQSDGQTIQYSGLLNETDWGSASSGIIDMHTIWSAGTDQVTAIVAFNAALVVFGTNHVVFFTDGRGSMLGLDPTQAYVFDVLTSVGAFSQWGIQPIGEGDIVFLGRNGLQSISNLQNGRSFPMSNLSKYVRDNLLQQVSLETTATITTSYNNFLGQFYLSLPSSNTIWCLDVRREYQDEVQDVCGIMTSWIMTATALMTTHTNVTYIARTPGTVGIYSGNTDEGSPYIFTYLSGWLNLGTQVAQKLKMLKRFEVIVFAGGQTPITLNWNTDFGATPLTATFVIGAGGAPAQYGLGQYGVSQYGGGLTLSIQKYDARARGQYYQIGITSSVTNLFSIQQIQLAVKIGRTA